MKTKILLTMVLAAALAGGCGGIGPVDSQTSKLAISELEMAPPSLVSGDIPGCDSASARGHVTLLRHPYSDSLVVVVVDGLARCIDTPNAVEHLMGQPLDQQALRSHCNAQGTQGQGQNQSQEGGDDEPPADDPIPIKGSGSAQQGGQSNTATSGDVSDDPLPILGQRRDATHAR